MKLILASQSPRRRELLAGLGLEFTVKAPRIDETAWPRTDPVKLVKDLSRAKALAVEGGEDDLILAADTVVVLEGTVLEKPRDEAEARHMLAALSGRTHLVCTGVTLRRGERTETRAETTRVTFRSLTPGEIDRYVDTGEPLDKAGGYGIQGYGALLVEGIRGDYSNVVGLPLCLVGRMLAGFGVDCLALAARREREKRRSP